MLIYRYRKPENEPQSRRQSLKQMATAIENTTNVSSQVEGENAILSELKPVLNLLHPLPVPAQIPVQATTSLQNYDDEVEESRFCGFLKVK